MTEDAQPVMSKLTAVGSESEADILRSVLSSEGIESFVPAATATAMWPQLSYANGIEIMVATPQLEQARAVLAELTKQDAFESSAPAESPATGLENDTRHGLLLAVIACGILVLILAAVMARLLS